MINGETFDRDFRTALKEFLETYFDGDTHDFGDKSIDFPEVDISFDRPQFSGGLARPHINIELYDDTGTKRKATGAGMTKQIQQPCRFLIYTADTKGIWDVNKNVSDLLDFIFNIAAAELAADGLKTMRVGGAVPVHLDASQEYQITQRIIRFKAEVTYDGVAP